MMRLGWSPDDGAVNLVAHNYGDEGDDDADDDGDKGNDDGGGHRVPAGHRGVAAMLGGAHPRQQIRRS